MSQTLTITAEQVLASAERIREDIVRDRRTGTRFFRAQAQPYGGKDLANPQRIPCGLFLVWQHFRSGKTAAHLTGPRK